MIGTRGPTETVSLPTWSVRDANGRADAFYLARQWSHYFGIEYDAHELPIELAEVAGWTSDEDSLDSLGTIAVHDPHDRDGSVPIGGALVSILDHEETLDQLPKGRFDADALVGDRTAWLWFGVVDPAWRGRGIGREMFNRRVEWAEAQGASLAVSFGWERAGPSSRRLFESDGWIPIQRFPDHYAENRDSCPDCGCWPSNDVDCSCELTLWAKDLLSGNVENSE